MYSVQMSLWSRGQTVDSPPHLAKKKKKKFWRGSEDHYDVPRQLSSPSSDPAARLYSQYIVPK